MRGVSRDRQQQRQQRWIIVIEIVDNKDRQWPPLTPGRYMNIKQQPTRNPTPNFIRFKKASSPLPKQDNNHNHKSSEGKNSEKNSERASSKNSRCSFEYYEKKILKNTFIKYSPYNKAKASHKDLDPRVNKLMKGHMENLRSSSNNSEKYRQCESSASSRGRDSVKKKRISGSGSNNKLKSPRRNESSLEKEETRAKEERQDLMKALTKIQRAPAIVNKLKLKKEDIKKPKIQTKRKFFSDPSIELKDASSLANYEVYGELGKGAYGTVRMAYDKKRNQKVAIKIYQKQRIDEPSKVKNIERQISIQAKLVHPTIAKIVQTIESPHEIYLILEYGGANSLYKYLLSKPDHRLEESEAKEFFLTLVEAISYLHSQSIVHRDIKAENILINREHKLKLIDFGFSLTSSPPNTIDTFCGTPTYMAPEIVSRMDHIAMYTDVWSLGILLFVLLQGNYPFRGRNEDQLFEKIKRGSYSFIYEDISAGSKSLIKKLLMVNPYKRPALKDLLHSEEWTEWLKT